MTTETEGQEQVSVSTVYCLPSVQQRDPGTGIISPCPQLLAEPAAAHCEWEHEAQVLLQLCSTQPPPLDTGPASRGEAEKQPTVQCLGAVSNER